MRKLVVLLFVSLLLVAVFWLFFAKPDKTEPLIYQGVIRLNPQQSTSINWNIRDKNIPTQQETKKDSSVSLRQHTPAKIGFGFSVCDNSGVSRPDSLAQKLSPTSVNSRTNPLLPIDCGVIKTSIPFSF